MSYYIAKTVASSFDDVVADVTARLKEQGFGLLTDIDVQATLKAKLGAEMPKYRILGACNPRFAAETLRIEDKLGVLTENPALKSTAAEVRRLLTRVVSQVGR